MLKTQIYLYSKNKKTTFVTTVHTTLPVRSASQGVSFAFITYVFLNMPHICGAF